MDQKKAVKIFFAFLALIFILFAISSNWFGYKKGLSFRYDTNDFSYNPSGFKANTGRDFKNEKSGFGKSPTNFISNNFSILGNKILNSPFDGVISDEQKTSLTEEELLAVGEEIAKEDIYDGLPSIDSASLNECSISHSSPYSPVLALSGEGATLNVPFGSRVFLPTLDDAIPDAGSYSSGFSIQRLGSGSVDIVSHDGAIYSVSDILNWFDFHNASVSGGYTFLGGHTLIEYQCNIYCNDFSGDLNGDGTINIIDMLLVVGNYGCSSGSCQGDLNGDGVVGVQDILLVSSTYGYSCTNGQQVEGGSFIEEDRSYSPVGTSFEFAKPSAVSPYNLLVTIKNTGSSRLRSLQTESLVPSIFNLYKSHAPTSGGSRVTSGSRVYVPSLYRDQSITYSFLVSFGNSICDQISKNYSVLELYGLCGPISSSILNSNAGSLYDSSDDSDREIYSNGLDPDYYFDNGIKDEDTDRIRPSRLQIETRAEKMERLWVHPRDKIIIKGY